MKANKLWIFSFLFILLHFVFVYFHSDEKNSDKRLVDAVIIIKIMMAFRWLRYTQFPIS